MNTELQIFDRVTIAGGDGIEWTISNFGFPWKGTVTLRSLDYGKKFNVPVDTLNFCAPWHPPTE